MQLSWGTVAAPEPIGALTVAVSEAGLCLVGFGAVPERALAAAARLGAEPVEDPRGTAPAAAQLAEYLAGGRRTFELPLDWRLTHGTQRTVLQALFAHVPYGATTTYAELAALSGAYEGHGYTAARGVGSIMGSNPIPVVVPCHRVMAAGGLGGFGGGRATKEWLLAHEGVLAPTLF
ncbi:methylated-DNA--[protein]-cysteine S-methyltransferase [Pseudonocardia kujensis]|uniref:methylated-DNA--[protein]-cysteine S-methyltransferase n=1 Tax=Pseudonocardia kujensis TaxID=1128675 RepID=UPI001E471071|nr:methylated-DNA--[protein]-cysteine S-methyltransferase [Pseudonocardia kujensis]MCE0761831.1 methylated-DNA--[protein]-cysteine S-methyltransferase [Pseudonocardia kujensis]